MHWKDWSWSSNSLATWCEELTHLKRSWCWERLKVGGEGDDRGWNGWMVSLTQRTWVWVSSRSWWWTGKPGVLQSMGSQRVRYDWAIELNRTNSSSGLSVWQIFSLESTKWACHSRKTSDSVCCQWKHLHFQAKFRILENVYQPPLAWQYLTTWVLP